MKSLKLWLRMIFFYRTSDAIQMTIDKIPQHTLPSCCLCNTLIQKQLKYDKLLYWRIINMQQFYGFSWLVVCKKYTNRNIGLLNFKSQWITIVWNPILGTFIVKRVEELQCCMKYEQDNNWTLIMLLFQLKQYVSFTSCMN